MKGDTSVADWMYYVEMKLIVVLNNTKARQISSTNRAVFILIRTNNP